MATSTNGQPVSESDRADRADCSEKIMTWGLGLLTILYIGGIGYLFGCDVWGLTQNNRMGEAGDFVAGFTTPVVFLWLIYGYFLQQKELGLQRKELQQTRETLGEQVEVLKEQADAERRRYMPHLSLQETGPSGQRRNFALQNFGGPAHGLEITLSDASGEEIVKSKPSSLDRGNPHKFSTPEITGSDPDDHFYYCSVIFISERQDRFIQGWVISIDETSPAEIHEEPLPTLLMPGETPPSMFDKPE